MKDDELKTMSEHLQLLTKQYEIIDTLKNICESTVIVALCIGCINKCLKGVKNDRK